MNKLIRTRIIATFFLIIFIPSIFPLNIIYASNNGPNAPEASGFESVNATDMVNLSSGDMAYVLPLMDVGGFPVSLSYHGGIPMDLESTWTGLGWNLNTGAINRGLNATPDDWNGGNSLDFIRYRDSETIYNVNVGVGICKVAEVGVGASWGSNKGMSGSVFASLGIKGVASVSGSIDTNGNYSLGVGAGGEKSGGFSAGVGVSGNINGGKTSVGFGVNYRSSSGMSVGLGTSLDGGLSASLGFSGVKDAGLEAKGQAGSASISMNSFSAGDWDISSKGWFVPIQIYFISFSFGKQKITYNLAKAYNKKGFGVLYSNLDNTNNDVVENDNGIDSQFTDYQNRYRYMDAYEQTLPQPEEEFVADSDADREKLNFSFAGYDSFEVNATGVSGVMNPRILQNATIFGLGYKGNDPKSSDGKMRIYSHNSLTTDKTFGKNTANDIEFYFNGQFTQNTLIPSVTPLSNSNTSLQGILSTRQVLNNQRLRQGNYVEVFTNRQIKNNQADGLLSPLSPTSNGLSLEALNRNTSEYQSDGIGGYKITAPDGKVYHFSQPVYHFEEVERTVLKDVSENNVSEKRQYTAYATHWLLTAITGPDFIDVNNNNIADAADYGYWVRMDYGKWSDGYVWRNPTDKNLKDYNSNLEGDIGEKEFGTYQFGRKQLYYLDRIVSATHTAYFVKDLRYDSVGSDLHYEFNPDITMTNDGTTNPNNSFAGNTVNPKEDFIYKRQMQLMLKKIILVKNENATVSKGNTSDNLKLSYPSSDDLIKSYQLPFASTGGFYEENGGQPNITLNNESGVYDQEDFSNFNYNNAIKVVNLDYNYNLATGSPGTISCSQNPNAGKLCLKSVTFLGRNNFYYMPPYQFQYKGEYLGPQSNYIMYPANALVQKLDDGVHIKNFSGKYINYPSNTAIPIADIRAKDEWGFLKDLPNQESEVRAAAWTMTRIITPTGSSIDFEHEEDDFDQEAFSRRFWNTNLKFSTTDLANDVLIEIQNQDGLVAGLGVNDFRDYFRPNERVYMDLWIARTKGGDTSRRGGLDVNSNTYCKVYEVTATSVKILASKIPFPIETKQTVDVNGVIHYEVVSSIPAAYKDLHPDYVQNCFFSASLGGSSCSKSYDVVQRGQFPDVPNCVAGIHCPDHWGIKYKILANKVPTAKSGGGIRVKSITLNDESNHHYKTNYYYNVPGTTKEKNKGNYISSGITSYSPVRGTQYVPFQSELPSPGVMYEYVTMESQNESLETLGQTRYHFYVLKPVFDIFNENIEMKDVDGTVIFKANVVNHNSEGGYLNQGNKIQAKSIKLDVNTSLIGQFKSIEEFNSKGQLLSKVERKYKSGVNLKQSGINRGSMTESFQSMKSVFTTNSSDENPVLKNRLLSISSKEEYSSVLESIITTGPHGKNIEEYSQTDPQTGAFLVVEKTLSNGVKTREERVPAYTKYSAMGSKVDNINNKNMLSQTAVDYSYIFDNGDWKKTGVGITTWKNEWEYIDMAGNTSSPSVSNQKIWRKHKNFVWKGQRDANGIFVNYGIDDDGFNWKVSGIGLNITQLPQWKQTSEIRLYDHFSNPLELKDINNNYVVTKMGDNNSKVIATANAGYHEMFYTSAENGLTGINGIDFLEPEIRLINASLTQTDFHTGKQCIATNSSSQFGVEMQSGKHRGGKYKLSVWVKANSAPDALLKVNNNNVSFTESIPVDGWVLKSAYVDVPAGLCTIYLNSRSSSPVYYDDLMIRPVSSSIKGYVYNEWDELTYIVGNNGLATKFIYDKAGRLEKTYTEVIDDSSVCECPDDYKGGFKLIKTNTYHNRFIN
ncbi:hypothetical protein [Flavobacterium aquiphilum]|uniref:hypothetical protein n=1 Tax=Flavobacterium aquiphilum TaxID=3003261 RepID=UPI0024817D96|nr:hypothetical protein [Flavobacterium aquiphilum]